MALPLLSKLGISRSSSFSPSPLHFFISLSATTSDNPVAYGPTSTIHGQVVLHISDRESTPADSVRVVFSGKLYDRSQGGKSSESGTSGSKKEKSLKVETLFEVESTLWKPLQHPGNDSSPSSSLGIPPGRHQYLFAIKFPPTNFPPTINDPNNPVRVAYTLCAFLDRPKPSRNDKTEPVEVWYLPLLQCPPSTSPTPPLSPDEEKKLNSEEKDEKPKDKREKPSTLSVVVPLSSASTTRQTLRAPNGEPLVECTAELSKPAFIPGENCFIRLNVNNRSDRRISTINVSLSSSVTSPTTESLSSMDGKPVHSQTHYSETISCSIPRNVQNHTENIQFKIPLDITPTSSLRSSRRGGAAYDIHYDLRLILFVGGTPLLRSLNSEQLCLTLPIAIGTVPSRFPLPPQLDIPSAINPSINQLPTLKTEDEGNNSRALLDHTQPYFLSTLDNSPGVISPPLSPNSPFSPWAGTPLPSPIASEMPILPSSSNDDHKPERSPSSLAGYLTVPEASRQHRKTLSGSSLTSNGEGDEVTHVEGGISEMAAVR